MAALVSDGGGGGVEGDGLGQDGLLVTALFLG